MTAPAGWTRIENAVIERIAEIGLAATAVYLVLRFHCGTRDTCWPSHSVIAAKCGITDRTVRRAIAKLVAAGLLKIEHQTSRGLQTVNRYTVLPLTPRVQGDTNDGTPGQKRPCARTKTTVALGHQCPTEQDLIEQDSSENKKKGPAAAGDPPGGLLELIDGWNTLGDQIVMRGNGARRDPPAKEVLTGWTRAQKNPEQAAAVADIPALLTAIRQAKFCHGQGWFDLAWLFAKNKRQQFNIARLMAGAYNGESSNGKHRTMPTGPGQVHPADAASNRF